MRLKTLKITIFKELSCLNTWSGKGRGKQNIFNWIELDFFYRISSKVPIKIKHEHSYHGVRRALNQSPHKSQNWFLYHLYFYTICVLHIIWIIEKCTEKDFWILHHLFSVKYVEITRYSSAMLLKPLRAHTTSPDNLTSF